MFKISDGKGFQITFNNGWTVSVQFGPGNYCNNRDISALTFFKSPSKAVEPCANAEIAAWDAKGEWHVFSVYRDEETGEEYGKERIKGWVRPDEVLAFMNEIASKPKEA